MSLLNAYNQVLNENKKEHEVKGAVKTGQDLASGFKVNKQEGPKVDSPKEDKEHSVDGNNSGELKKLAKEATNPFDAIYNKILAQENWEAEEEANEQPDFSGATDNLEFSGDHSTGEGEIDLEDDSDEDPMKQVLTALRSAVEALEKIVGSEEEEEEEGEEEPEEDGSESGDNDEEPEDTGSQEFGESTESEEDEEDEEEDEVKEEEVDAEVLGHALVDLEKLAASLTSPKSHVLKGAVPVSKGKAQTPKGGKVNSEPTELKGKGENLQSKKNDTGLVKKDKNWYDQ